MIEEPRAASRGDHARLPADVVKVGGSLAREPGALRGTLAALAQADAVPLVVPGGGPLADAVRRLHAGGGLSEETAHRMALLALDQCALWLADLAGPAGRARVVSSREEIARALDAGELPVLAPSRWLEVEDSAGELPASWQVTSDSIAAWTAGRIGARRLLLLKSFAFRARRIAPAELRDVVDAFFLRALPPDIECRFVDGREPAGVLAALSGEPAAGTLLEEGGDERVPGTARSARTLRARGGELV